MSVLDSLEFAPVLITDVFDTVRQAPSWLNTNQVVGAAGMYPHVTNSALRNSVSGFIVAQGREPNPGNAVTIGIDTQVVAFQPMPFYGATKVMELRASKLNKSNALVLVASLRKALEKFSWGHKASAGRIARTKIMVPVTTDEAGEQFIDWEGMSLLGEELFTAAAKRSAMARQTALPGDDFLPTLTFEPRYVMDVPGRQAGLFRAHKGKRLITAHRKRGTTPFVAGSRVNNSIVDYADVEPIFPGGWLTLIYNGDGGTGHAKYQPVPFSASDDVIALEPIAEVASEDALLLLVTMLTHQCVPKFGFGYKLTLHRLGRQKIMVPVAAKADGETVVDWEGMAAYGRALRVRAERGLNVVLEPVLCQQEAW